MRTLIALHHGRKRKTEAPIMIVDDSFNYQARLNELSCSIIAFHQKSCSLDMSKLDMIVRDSFFLFEQEEDSE